MRRRLAAAVAALALLTACGGEPAVHLDVPDREQGRRVLDLAGVLDDAVADSALRRLEAAGHDVVLVTWESEDAGMGTADRLGRKVLDAWEADIALVAVAAPGDFDSREAGRERYFGLFAREVRAVPAGLRERIAEELVPPIAARNDWTLAFDTAARALADGLGD